MGGGWRFTEKEYPPIEHQRGRKEWATSLPEQGPDTIPKRRRGCRAGRHKQFKKKIDLSIFLSIYNLSEVELNKKRAQHINLGFKVCTVENYGPDSGRVA